MTPEEAQKLLNGTEPGGWSLERYDYVLVLESNGETTAVEINEEEAPLIAHAPELAATVAGMTPEYCEVDWDVGYVQVSPWDTEKPEGGMVARRYVTNWELI